MSKNGSHPTTEQTSGHLSGPVSSMLAVSVLIVTGTASLIAWERYGRPTPGISHVPPSLPQTVIDIEMRLNALQGETDHLRSELAALTVQGGVLERIVTHLQEARSVDAAHNASIRELFNLSAQTGAAFANVPEAVPTHLARPVQVTPVNAERSNTPQRVIVTPDPLAVQRDTRGQGQ